MLKKSIVFNSISSFSVVFINFIFKMYLTRKFLPQDLVVVYAITEILSLISRFFSGYHDILITKYNTQSNKRKKNAFLKYFAICFFILIIFLSFVAIPLINKFYIEVKIEHFNISWLYISILFIFISFNGFLSSTCLVRKFYLAISIVEISRAMLFVAIVLMVSMNVDGLDYSFLLKVNIVIEVIVFLYLTLLHTTRTDKEDLGYLIKLERIKINIKSMLVSLKMICLASARYFVYGLILFAPMFCMINEKNTQQLANYQVIARSVYFALITTFSWPIGRFLFPHLTSKFHSANVGEISNIRLKLIKLLILFNFLIIFLCFLLSKIFVSLFFPEQYINSYQIINIIIISLPFVMYSNFSQSIIKANGSYGIDLLIAIYGLISYIISYKILNIIQIQYASIYAFDVSMICIFCVSLYYELKIIRKLK